MVVARQSVYRRPASVLGFVALAAIAFSFLGGFWAVDVGGRVVVLCEFRGSDTYEGMEIRDVIVYGPREQPRVGDTLTVFFTLTYVGEGAARLRRVLVKARAPDGSVKEFEDMDWRGRYMPKGLSKGYHTEVVLSEPGVWVVWPSIEFSVGGRGFETPAGWHGCTVKVLGGEGRTATTTTRVLPDLAFDPRHSAPVGYGPCSGFYAYIRNIGAVETPRNTSVLFTVYSGSRVVWEKRVEVPRLLRGSVFVARTGPFLGVPGRSYRARVVIDPDMRIAEASELNNARWYRLRYTRSSLPVFDLRVKELRLLPNATLLITAAHTGCVDSPPVEARVTIEEGDLRSGRIVWGSNLEELGTVPVPAMHGVEEVVLRFSSPRLRERVSRPLHRFTYMRIVVRLDNASVAYRVEGETVTIEERSYYNNVKDLVLGEVPVIEGPSTYFLPAGSRTYVIRNPGLIWRARSRDATSFEYEYRAEGCGARVVEASRNRLTLSVGDCPSRSFTLVVRARSRGGGAWGEKPVTVYLYTLHGISLGRYGLRTTCVSREQLNVTHDLLFTDVPIELRFEPGAIINDVTYTIYDESSPIGAVFRYSPLRIKVVVSIETPRGWVNRTIPRSRIRIGYPVVFTIPTSAVFPRGGLLTRARVYVVMTLGTGQRVEGVYGDYLLHSGQVFPVYLRSFHFRNTPCPEISWGMWERFWGEDAVWDHLCICSLDGCDCYKTWKDAASWALYRFVFKEMCRIGRCSSYALVSQKFFEGEVSSVGRCSGSFPQPFTLLRDDTVRMWEAPPSRSFDLRTMSLDTYLTYQYMWSLDERNLRRGFDKFTRWLLGDDIVRETLEELIAWQNLPEDRRWRSMYVLQMIPPEDIRRGHSVLAYRVEVVNRSYARVWVIDSNRPFQPNSSVNQGNSYIEFYRLPSGRWEYRFRLDDAGRTILHGFIFATNTSMLHGESSALTEGDVIDGLLDFVEATFSRMGYATGGENKRGAVLYIVGSGRGSARVLQVGDSAGGKLFDGNGAVLRDPSRVSKRVFPIPLPGPGYAFVSRDRGVSIRLVHEEQGEAMLVAQEGNRSLSIAYTGARGAINRFVIAPSSITVGGRSIGGYTVTARLVSRELPHEIVLRVRSANTPFTARFTPSGTAIVRNLGNRPLVIDIAVARYGAEGRDSESYTGIEIAPGATAVATPRNWSSVSGGALVVEIDEGSDGTVDRVEEAQPRAAGARSSPPPTTPTTSRTTTTTAPTGNRTVVTLSRGTSTPRRGTPTLPRIPISPTTIAIAAIAVIAVAIAVAALRRRR